MAFNAIDYARRYRKIFSNYMNVLIRRVLSLYPITVRYKDGRIAIAYSKRELWYLSFGWSFDEEGVVVSTKFSKDRIKFTGTEDNGDLVDIFGLDVYGFLAVKGTTIIDIGANIGDSALYFISRDAKRVISIEPFPYTYSILMENLRVNKQEHNVLAVNAACSYESVQIDAATKQTANLLAGNIDHGQRINTLTLEEIVELVGDVYDLGLKVDCEGCEYQIFENALDSTLKKFKRMQIEYHHGISGIVERLNRLGFVTSYTTPRRWIRENNPDPEIQAGYIYATQS